MRVDTMMQGTSIAELADEARDREKAGYDGLWTFETAHDPFVQLMPVAEHSERLAVGTAIAVAFARSPMTMAYTANDLQNHSRGRLLLGLGSQVKPHIERRFNMPWSSPAPRMREYISALARDLGVLEQRRAAELPRRLLLPHPHDAVLLPRAQPVGPAPGLPGRGRRAHDAGGGRGVRRAHPAPLHDRSATCGSARSRCWRRASPRAGAPSTASRSACRGSWSPAAPRRRWRPPTSACAARSRSTAAPRRTTACSSCTAGASSAWSSTGCRAAATRTGGCAWAS